MSADLKPGDVCEIVKAECMLESAHKYIGLQCTIIERIEPSPLIALIFGIPPTGYRIETSSGESLIVCHHWLRKKQPPQELGSWKEIACLTNWNPVRDGVTA